MSRAAILLALLAGCAAPPPVTCIVTVTPEVPPQLLVCAPAPVIPVVTSQAGVANYMVSLWQAGQDCRAHVAAISAVIRK